MDQSEDDHDPDRLSGDPEVAKDRVTMDGSSLVLAAGLPADVHPFRLADLRLQHSLHLGPPLGDGADQLVCIGDHLLPLLLPPSLAGSRLILQALEVIILLYVVLKLPHEVIVLVIHAQAASTSVHLKGQRSSELHLLLQIFLLCGFHISCNLIIRFPSPLDFSILLIVSQECV